MKRQTVEVFHELMKKGWIDRSESPDIWRAYDDPDVIEELETIGALHQTVSPVQRSRMHA